MTDDVNLPPLPHLPLNDPAAAYKAVYDYAKECATAAIEPYAKRIAELESQLDAIGAGGVTQGQRLIKADRQRRGGEPSGAKWYTQSRKGFVQGPCEDEAQATKFALMRSEAFPDYGPYIAICLAPVFAKPTAPQPTEPVQEPSDELRSLSDRAYCQYIDQMSRPENKGVDYKLENNKFGALELAAHNKAHEYLGRHRAFSEALALLARYGSKA